MKDYKKVKFHYDFRDKWIEAYSEIDGNSKDLTEAIYLNGDYKDSFDELELRLSGNIGFVYHDCGQDWFEKEDDNWCIPESCFEFLD